MRSVSARIAGAAASTALVGAALGVGLPSATGCTTHQCDPSSPTYSGGEMIDDNTYETSPIQQPDSGVGSDEPWIPFAGNATLTVTFPPTALAVIAGREPNQPSGDVGVSAQPNAADSNFTPAAGGLVEFNAMSSKGFTVLNNTCASYFARFVVSFPERDASGDASARVVPLDASE